MNKGVDRGDNLLCVGCQGTIDGRLFLRCCVCEGHYDLTCANVSEKRFFNTMTSEHKANWKCVSCYSKQYIPKLDTTPATPTDNRNVNCRRGGSTMSPESPSAQDYRDMTKSLDVLHDSREPEDSKVSMQALAVELRAYRDEMRASRIQSQEHMREFMEFREEMQAVRVQAQALQSSISTLIEKVESNELRLNELTTRVAALEVRVSDGSISKNEDNHLLKTIDLLKADLNDREQELLLNDIEISCIPEQREESTQHIVMVLAKKLGVDLVERDIVCATRVGPVPDRVEGSARRPRPIVVRLVRRAVRDKLLQEARVRRGATTADTDLPGAPRRFYVNERLTRVNRHLFRRARDMGVGLNWRYIWTRDGKIFARQHAGQGVPRHRLRTEADLERVFGQVPISTPENKQNEN